MCVCVGTPADYYLPYPSESVSRNTHKYIYIYIYGSTIEAVSTEWVRGGWNKLLVWWCWGGRREYAGLTGGSGTGQFRSDGHGGGV